MITESFNLKIVLILTTGFALASIFGYLSHRAKLTPILGYLLGGYIIGPYSPGFVADLQISEQLAEIGVILMLFGVGLHFKWQDLMNVKNIAIPGALGQTFLTTSIVAGLVVMMGWSLQAGIVYGLAIGVASTVVLVRVLSDYGILNTVKGHICVGWLIVEDIVTVIALLLIPALAASLNGEGLPIQSVLMAILVVLSKFILFVALMFTLGRKFVMFVFNKIVLTNSHELFTLTILALTFVIATGSSMLFGTSIALGAFIAGMIIGQTDVRHQVSNNALPLKDTFLVIFFLSVGMLFNPAAITDHLVLFLEILGLILVIKPVIALFFVLAFKQSFKTALTISVALAQIGEFSFILIEEAMKYNILPDEGYDIIVACSLVSISLNPLLFKLFRI
jgi:CPA2 family monovalent cation:H+ antiporter-2